MSTPVVCSQGDESLGHLVGWWGSTWKRDQLCELRQACLGPVRTNTGHIQGGHDTFGLTEIIPPDVGDLQHRKLLWAMGENLMGKVCFVHAFVKRVDETRFLRRAEEG